MKYNTLHKGKIQKTLIPNFPSPLYDTKDITSDIDIPNRSGMMKFKDPLT